MQQGEEAVKGGKEFLKQSATFRGNGFQRAAARAPTAAQQAEIIAQGGYETGRGARGLGLGARISQGFGRVGGMAGRALSSITGSAAGRAIAGSAVGRAAGTALAVALSTEAGLALSTGAAAVPLAQDLYESRKQQLAHEKLVNDGYQEISASGVKVVPGKKRPPKTEL
jgi:hypothetical protein